MYEVGEVFSISEGSSIVVLEKLGRHRVVKFINTGNIKRVNSSSIKNKCIKDELAKSILNMGFIGVGNYTHKKDKFAYLKWYGMLKRCYSSRYHEKNPSYINTTVCEEWLNFQNFAVWYYANVIEGYDLDKDILQYKVKNKVYSPSTCVFIHPKVNNFIANLVLNVSPKLNKNGYRLWAFGGYYGVYKDIETLLRIRRTIIVDKINCFTKNTPMSEIELKYFENIIKEVI
ncbi:MAG: hypothetical protein ACRDDY_03815 [Clostridium sp.]|uniref:hypothetical protein n=1 Tax=Clostridium sp. TaxID=1506 RepID=UPI003EE5806D